MADYANHQLAGKWIEVKRATKKDQMGGGGGPPGKGGDQFGKGGGAYTQGAAFGGYAPAYPPAYGQGGMGGGGFNPYAAYGSYDQGGAAGKGAFRGRPY